MGLFDFLKTTVVDPKKKPASRAGGGGGKGAGSFVSFDGKSFPLAAITPKGFVTAGFDGSLIAGQNARLSVSVDDAYGRFSFTANVAISEADGRKCVGAWMMLPPELEAAIRQYSQKKKAGGK